ncbi:DNA polymerase III subunit beta [Nocardioides jejuensis]|uniref:DNA polymerase III beta sliding clamp N-terminal domain-containing protein n=1 Tax=Nocardioides jejuensis TaxID=2502782 RepID=A0A4R1BZ99_9ACTN|nr:hypothetical protein [Nocardioides jejuensis]TCJ23037.1 hypothetical protein EPD65_11790 [Nocardioides jejuensis]
MHITADRKTLTDTATWVARAAPRRAQIAALAGIHVTATDGAVRLQAFSYDVGHTARITATTPVNGEALIPAAFLTSVLAGLRANEVELTVEGRRLTVTAGRSTYSTQLLSLADWPNLPDMPPIVGQIPAGLLEDLISAVEYPIDDGTPHDQVRGLHLEGSADELVAVGADRSFIAEATVAWAHAGDFAASVPSVGLLGAVRGLGDVVQIAWRDGLLGLTDGTREVTMRTFVGEYVPWRRLLRDAADDDVSIVVDAAELLGAAKRTSALLPSGTGTVVIDATQSEIAVSSRSEEAGGTEYLDATTDISDTPFTTGIAPRYLIGLLGSFPGGPVRIGAVAGRKPLTFRPLDHPGITYIVQPKRTGA